jgi:hypothetical protein
MVGLGLLGGFIRLKSQSLPVFFRAAILGMTFLLYFVIVSHVFQAYLLVMNAAYHLLAFGLSYWTVATVKKRWFT